MGRPINGYRNAAGERIPGVTTIIGRFKESGGLLQWAFKQGQAGVPHLYHERDKAAEAGGIAHDMIEAHILKKPFPDCMQHPEELQKKARNAFEQYLEWRGQTSIEILETETPYVSEAHQFGGTIDALGRDAKGRTILLDWKTSNAVYQDYLIQLAAYALLLEECTVHRPQGFHLLRISKESADFAHHFFGELEEAKRAFILMRELYDIDSRLKKRAA